MKAASLLQSVIGHRHTIRKTHGIEIFGFQSSSELPVSLAKPIFDRFQT